MKNLIRILLTVSGAIFFLILVLVTFSSEEKYLEVPSFNNFSTGANIYSSGANHSWFKNNITAYDSLYSSVETSEVLFSSGVLSVDITEPAKYMSSFFDIQSKYVFSGEGYSILQEGIGEIFIDSETIPGKVFVFALNTSAVITLKNIENGESYTDIYLYPHMYVEITPSRGKFLKGADMIRIDTVFNIGYIGQSVFKDDFDLVSSRYINSEDNFFIETYGRIKNFQTSSRKILEIFKTQDIDVLSKYEILDRYKSLFINDEKKRVIVKNRVLQQIISILTSQRYEEILITKIQTQLKELKSLSEEDYNEMKLLIKNLIYLNNTDAQIDTTISKLMLSSLIYDDIIFNSENFLLYGFSIFSNYDSTATFNTTFFDLFLSSFVNFRPISDVTDVAGNSEYQYFSYFLEKNISVLTNDQSEKIDIAFINKILEKFISIWAVSYDTSVVARISGIYVYSSTLSELDIFLREKYFLPERDTIGLLQIDTDQEYNVAQLGELSLLVKSMFDIYERNEKFLSQDDLRDIAIRKDFNLSRKKLEEYFSALESYDLYVTKYDELRQEIINVDTIKGGQSGTSLLSQEEIQNYLVRFKGLDLAFTKVTIIDDRYYSIDNVKISGKSFNFDIYPLEDYKLTNIFIDNIPQNVQYKLSIIEDNFSESGPSNPGNDEEVLAFEGFFINTFFNESGNDEVEEYVQDQIRESEDKAEIFFKESKLLGEEGEFSNILETLPISYNDISLIRKSLNYDIFIEGTNFFLGGMPVSFSSQYFLTQIDHHFADIVINLETSNNSIKTQIKVAGKVHINDILKVLQDLENTIPTLSTIEYVLDQKNNTPENVFATYSSFNKKSSIKFDLNGETYTIGLENGEIHSLYVGINKLISNPIAASELEEYLP